MSFEEYEPKSTLVVPQHPVQRAKYPFIDVHNHQSRGLTPECVDKLVADMDALNLRVMVNLERRLWRLAQAHGRGAEGAASQGSLRGVRQHRFQGSTIRIIRRPRRRSLQKDVDNGAQGLRSSRTSAWS